MLVYQCEDSLEGIFSAIYQAYEERQKPEDTYISVTEDMFLFAEYKKTVTDPGKAVKVMRTLRRKFGEEDYYSICLALATVDEEKAQAVYRTVARGLEKEAARGHLLDGQADDQVRKVFELARNAGREYHHLIEFLRFEELQNGILYATIKPKNNLLVFLMPHFADRFPGENFIICDKGRSVLSVHPAGEEWYLLKGEEMLSRINGIGLADGEKEYQELFRHFCNKIAIRERKNLRLQRNLLPLHFREYMVEFR